jgi:hypothetical protein
MKATLVKKAEGWYNLYQNNVGIGSTQSELQGYKLSKENCDEIFGIVDVEKLAEQEVFQEYYDWGGEVFSEDYLISKRLHFIEGFNKAMELNGDKMFTVEDIKRAFIAGSNFTSPDEVVLNKTFGESMISLIKSLQQPTEIGVEVDMEDYVKYVPKTPGNTVYPDRGVKPKLDENDCLILTKAEQ